MKPSKGLYFTLGAALFWALSIIVTKFLLLKGENVLNLIFWVLIFAFPFWIIIFSKNFNEFKKITKKDYLLLIAIALVGMIILNIVDFFAIKYSQAINYSFLIRTSILFTIFFAFIFLGEKVTLKKVILALVILTGAFFLTTKGQRISFSLGDILTIIDAALISFGNTILGKMAIKRMSAGLSASASFLICILPIALIAFFYHQIALPRYIYLIILAAVFSVAGTLFRFKAYQNASASFIAMIYSVTPIIVLVLAIPLLGETMTPVQLIGGALIVLSGIFVERFKI